MNWFGRSSKKVQVETANVDNSSQSNMIKMRNTLEMLEKKERHLETKINNELEVAKKNATTNKGLALSALKRKKMYEQQVERTRGARMNLETQLMTIEDVNMNMETFNAIKMASSTLQTLHGNMSVDKVDDTMDLVREQMDIANEINVAISTPLGMDSNFDEDEALRELEELEQLEMDSIMLDVKSPSTLISSASHIPKQTLPSIPSTVKVPTTAAKTQSAEEAELEELRASMALN